MDYNLTEEQKGIAAGMIRLSAQENLP